MWCIGRHYLDSLLSQRLILHNAHLLFGNIWVVSNKKIFRTLNNLGSQSLKKDYSIEYLILFGWSLMENYDFLKSTGYFLGGLIDENINFQ